MLDKELLLLRFSPLFRSMDEAGLERVFSSIKYSKKSYKKGAIVAFAGDTCNSLLIPLRGSVRGEMIDSAGRCLKIEDIKAPTPLAIAFIFGKENQYPVNVIANEDTTMLRIPQVEILKLMMKDPCFLHVFLNLISNRVQFLTEKISFLSFHTIKEKLSHYMLRHEINFTVTFPNSHEKMAELFGITRPSFSRGLKDLQTLGAIEFSRRSVTILDKAMLISILEGGE